MPIFDTPEPISVILEFDIGSARIVAGDRTDTVVEVLPTDGANDDDVRAAQQTKVTCSGGTLLVKGPRKRSLFGMSGSLDISVEVPAGSDVRGTAALADFVCDGRLGDCRIKTAVGDIQVDQAKTAHLKTDHGEVRVDRVAGDAEIAGVGRIDVGGIGGRATLKNSNGETTVGEVAGELEATSSNGRVNVGVARAGVEVRAASGGIRVGEVARGRVMLQTALGDVEVGIRESTAAWLDVNTRIGRVRNSLGPSEGPEASDETVEIRARTGLGDIVIRRS
ncbi:DUF4097 family beta strand repeat-containing protein [Planotetraspora kaengkrachanensis]|uniref:DUF4097 domain-containing protein n=1 Tax=Planotetraspora kaengkrachanensis TaxID=575193 RepID=A0A8J3LU43_9ACTN|nr:DUF4097 family beta strand repeat-containing protein [Planotetraspora kaengkrachanensis]GIG78792.1 hypothetical protein Pka01_19190 [Planotetraspora kaengkrachanensis]